MFRYLYKIFFCVSLAVDWLGLSVQWYGTGKGSSMTITCLSEQKIRKALGKMFIAFPGSGACKESGDRMEVYVEAVRRFPLSYIEEACDYAVRGKLGNGAYPPSAPQLRELVSELQDRDLRKLGHKKFSWEKSDEPVHNTPEQRARIIAGFKELLSDLRSGNPIDPDRATLKVFPKDE